MTLKHLSLFSGIGGLDLAAEMTGKIKTVGQCEWADYPHQVLEKHWPDVPKWRDIHELSADDFRKRTGIQSPTIISGGFPCQPHSLAGKRKASDDERDLWPEYRRAISELKPRWVVAENVRGLLTSENGRFFRGILRDFANMGYDVGWCTYPAAWIGAIHRRERVFIVAHANCKRLSGRSFKGSSVELRKERKQQLPRFLQPGFRTTLSELLSYGTDYGIPHRMDRIKCLGNAVVPQQAYPIFQAIADIEEMLSAG